MTVTNFTANIAQNDTIFANSILSTWKEMQGTPGIELECLDFVILKSFFLLKGVTKCLLQVIKSLSNTKSIN